jgi:hypothetical protein
MAAGESGTTAALRRLSTDTKVAYVVGSGYRPRVSSGVHRCTPLAGEYFYPSTEMLASTRGPSGWVAIAAALVVITGSAILLKVGGRRAAGVASPDRRFSHGR